MSELTQKLRRLGVVRGTRDLVSPPRPSQISPCKEALPPGQRAETTFGVCFYIETRYSLDHLHGHSPLASLLVHDPATAARIAVAPQPERIRYPSAPQAASQETAYTRQLRERLARESGGTQAPPRPVEEPIDETLRRLYP